MDDAGNEEQKILELREGLQIAARYAAFSNPVSLMKIADAEAAGYEPVFLVDLVKKSDVKSDPPSAEVNTADVEFLHQLHIEYPCGD